MPSPKRCDQWPLIVFVTLELLECIHSPAVALSRNTSSKVFCHCCKGIKLNCLSPLSMAVHKGSVGQVCARHTHVDSSAEATCNTPVSHAGMATLIIGVASLRLERSNTVECLCLWPVALVSSSYCLILYTRSVAPIGFLN